MAALASPFETIRAALAKNASAIQGVSVSAVYAGTNLVESAPDTTAAAAASTASAVAEAVATSRTAMVENGLLRELVAALRAELADQEEQSGAELVRFRRQAEIHATLLAAAHEEVCGGGTRRPSEHGTHIGRERAPHYSDGVARRAAYCVRSVGGSFC